MPTPTKTPAPAAKPPHVHKTAPDTKQELRDAAAHLAKTAHNGAERRFYAAQAAEMDRQLAFDAARAAATQPSPPVKADPGK